LCGFMRVRWILEIEEDGRMGAIGEDGWPGGMGDVLEACRWSYISCAGRRARIACLHGMAEGVRMEERYST
jgi:hypothetical protein